MRLFAGIAPATEVQARMREVLDELRPLAPHNWSPVENLHVTLKFIGEWPETRLPELKDALAAVPAPSPFPISIGGFGYFPNAHHPKALFAGITAGSPLAELAHRMDDDLNALGIAREDRPYRPHLTLARIKNENVRAVREHIAKMTDLDFGTFDASEFHLYLSRPSSNRPGSVYTSLVSYPLAVPTGSPA